MQKIKPIKVLPADWLDTLMEEEKTPASSVKITKLTYIFKEEANQSYYLDLRVSIEGQEVSQWVEGNISITISEMDKNTLSLTISNPDDLWILTEENLRKKNPVWRHTSDLSNEEPKHNLYLKKSKINVYDPVTKQYSYPMSVHTTIFHVHDCIRVWGRNPLSGPDMWMPLFTGFINKYPITEDYITGVQPITIEAYCLKGIMEKMRVNINPIAPLFREYKDDKAQQSNAAENPSNFSENSGNPSKSLNLAEKAKKEAEAEKKRKEEALIFSNQKDLVDNGKGEMVTAGSLTATNASADGLIGTNAGHFADLFIKKGWFNHILAGRDFETCLNMLILGIDGVALSAKEITESKKLYGLKQIQTTVTEPEGSLQPNYMEKSIGTITGLPAYRQGQIGRMRKGKNYIYDLKSTDPNSNSLEKWNNWCLLGNAGGTYYSFEEVTNWLKASVSDNVWGSPFNMEFRVLLPKEGLVASTMMQVDFESMHDYGAGGANFQTRLELINQACTVLDYKWYCTPLGDIAFEFPMYDFTEKAFGKTYKNCYVADLHLTSSSIEDESSDVPTALVVTGTETNATLASINAGTQKYLDRTRTVIYSPMMAMRRGTVVETIEAPVGVGAGANVSTDGMNSQMGAKGLEAWGFMHLQKRIGESSTMQFSLPWRPWLLPNRPIKQNIRKRIGIIRSVSHVFQEGQSANTEIILQYLKTLGNDGKYRYMTGGENQPIGYGQTFTGSGGQTTTGMESVPKAPDAGRTEPQQPEEIKRDITKKSSRIVGAGDCENGLIHRAKEIMPWVQEASKTSKLEVALILALLQGESELIWKINPSSGAVGYGQLIIKWQNEGAKRYSPTDGVYDHRANVIQSAMALKANIDKYKIVELAICYYNRGKKNMNLYAIRREKDPSLPVYPDYNKIYRQKILSAYPAWKKRLNQYPCLSA